MCEIRQMGIAEDLALGNVVLVVLLPFVLSQIAKKIYSIIWER